MEELNDEVIEITEDFIKIICDLTQDLMNTFPDILNSRENPIKEISLLVETDISRVEKLIKELYIYCRSNLPKYFFDILYENNDIFVTEEEIYLLPNINFVELWKTDITDTTKSTIWKYLQLILFTVVADIKSGDSFGDTAKLFEAINTDEFKEKIEASLHDMESLFKQKYDDNENVDNDEENIPIDLPKAEDLHAHINKMMGGKIGCLAKEIAEETAEELDIDMSDATSVNDVFNKLFKNPTKLMDLVKNVGGKLDTKIKSGDIKETELLQEATEFVSNMKNMPGMGNLESLFSKMGVPGMGGGGKVDMGALNREMEKNLKNAKIKERMRNKLDKNKKEQKSEIEGELKNKGINDFGMEELIYSLGDHPEKSKPQNKPRNRKKKKKRPVVTVEPVVEKNTLDLN
jgi:hypothetical protein